VQERWFAKLYLLKALGLVVFLTFWITTGLVSLGPGWQASRGLMLEGGIADPLASLIVVAGALADVAIGVLIAFHQTNRLGLYTALAVSFVYMVEGTILLPRLWEEPLGPLLKIWPIMAFNLMLLAIREDR
jgi:hypothetical protein